MSVRQSFDSFILRKVLKENKDKILPILFIACLLLIPILLTNGWLLEGKSMKIWWDELLEPWMGVFTFLVASFIAYVNYRQIEIAKMDKLLNVHLKCEERYIMSYWGAYLSHESDIRQWSMQIGAQMTKNRVLKFYPYIVESGPTQEFWNDKYYNVYTATLFLEKVPEHGKDRRVEVSRDMKDKYDFENIYLIWSDNNIPETPGYHKYIISHTYRPLDPRISNDYTS